MKLFPKYDENDNRMIEMGSKWYRDKNILTMNVLETFDDA